MARRVYWDACAFLGLINPGEPHHADCRAVWQEGLDGKTIIVTSFFTWGEVFKAKCEQAKPLDIAGDQQIEALLRHTFIEGVLVDEAIGIKARRLMRSHPECKKPSDGIHLATALVVRVPVEEMHTFDKSDLLKLSGKVVKSDGSPLTICLPKPLPAPPQLPPAGDPEAGPGLFDSA